jgi:PLP dependent protein
MSTALPNPDPIPSSLSSILSTIQSASSSSPVRLVAVSKYIPAERIQVAYTAGQRHFGENYIQELVSKSSSLPDDIKWHFIGALQSNKCKQLVAEVKNLWCVETVDSEKKARLLEAGAASIDRNERLKVFVQVNTSDEERNICCRRG